MGRSMGLVLLIVRWVWIIAVAVAVTDLAVATVNYDFTLLVYGDFTRNANRFLLGFMD